MATKKAPGKTAAAKKSSPPAKKPASARKAAADPAKRADKADNGKTTGQIVRMGPSLK
jgi:hypothetical protein